MKAEQFIYGLFKHHGTRLITSNGIRNLLTEEITRYLCNLTQPNINRNLWPNGTVTVTKIVEAHDEYGRKGVWNHTVAFRLVDYLAEAELEKLVQFLDPLPAPPAKLESLKVNI